MDRKESQYAALAPLLAFAGIFIHPVASTLLPLMLYFLFAKLSRNDAACLSLRTADLAFSIWLYKFILSAIPIVMTFFFPVNTQTANELNYLATMALLLFLTASLLVAFVQALRGKIISYPFSFRMAERLLRNLGKAGPGGNS